MPTSQLPCCECGCVDGRSCYRGYSRGCSHPCCWCKNLIGLDTCDTEYAVELAACEASLYSSETDFCDKTITVDISTTAAASGMTIERTFADTCGAGEVTHQVPWTTSYQVTNYGYAGHSEGAGDAPFWSPCPEAVPFSCDRNGIGGSCDCDDCCQSGYTHPGDSCWSHCPTSGVLWKPSHFDVEDVSTWPGTQNITGLALAYQGAVVDGEGCSWKGSTPLAGTAERIWLVSNGGIDTMVMDSETCDAGCSCCSSAGDYCPDCCHCHECGGTFDNMTNENGCCFVNQGGCTCQTEAGGCSFPYGGCGAEPHNYFWADFSDGGYRKYYVPVNYTLTYTLYLRWGPSDSDVGIPPAYWYHHIELSYTYDMSSIPTDSGGAYVGDWAYGAGETWTPSGAFQPPAAPYYDLGLAPNVQSWIQCSTADCAGSGCDCMPGSSQLSSWTRCEAADMSGWGAGGGNACAHQCGSAGGCAQWVTDGGPAWRVYPFWYEHIDSYTPAIDFSCWGGGACTGCNAASSCSETHLNNGFYLDGTATLYRQEVVGALQCFSKCPVPLTWSQGGWTATMYVND